VALLTGVRSSPADRARTEGRRGFVVVRRPKRANYRGERGSGRERFTQTESLPELQPWRTDGVQPNTLTQTAESERTGRGSGEGTEWRRSGGVGRRPDRVMPVGRTAAAMSPAYGRHVAGAGWSKQAHPRARGGREELGRAAERAEREAGRHNSACPLSLFFGITFLKYFAKLILTHLKSFSGFAPKTKFVTNKKFYNFGLS